MSDPLYSTTIPCKRCGKIGESIFTVVGWLCGQCIMELVEESVRETKLRRSE